MTQRELEDLPPDECFRLLGAAHVGRLVYQDDLGPLAVPVNYAMAGHDIVFRVEGGAKRAAMQQPMLAFEVDHVDEDRKFGWSVLVRGVGAEVDLERVPSLLRAMDGHGPTPWAAGISQCVASDCAAHRDRATARCGAVVVVTSRFVVPPMHQPTLVQDSDRRHVGQGLGDQQIGPRDLARREENVSAGEVLLL
ncbi:MAG: pyridoxamine 5'-phosphate oxidase family protein, partial [Mycobacterium sp.]|uniref:pyridoxamine 5'-phosphate oxidase family protein n=1 Tax=Mycobacterium sp. TaxID=1785 RepID=UPI003F94415C